MASGIQAGAKPAANTNTALFTATNPIVVTINACNTSTTASDTAAIWVVPNGGSPTSNNQIENFTDLAAKGVIERTGVVLGAGDSVFVESSGAGNTNFVCWGVEL